MATISVASLVRQGRIEKIERDADTAKERLSTARRHLKSAESVADVDAEGAYALLYDAARKAVDAHMLANGYRISKSRLGAHQATALYAVATLGSGSHAKDVNHLDRMRRNRNRSEYDIWEIGASTIRRDLEHARGIVHAVEDQV